MICPFYSRFQFMVLLGIVVSMQPLAAQDVVPALGAGLLTKNGEIRSTEKPVAQNLAGSAESVVPDGQPMGAVSEAEPASQEGPTAAVPMDPQTLAEIKAIRQRLGGSVTEQLSELFQGSPDRSGLNKVDLEREFERQIAILAGLGQRSPSDSGAAYANANNRVNLPSESSVKRIQMAARLLEQAAAELELASRFGDADSIREKARQLWRQARPSGAAIKSPE